MRTSNGSKVVRELDTWLGLGRRAYARASCEQEFATECDHRGLSGSRIGRLVSIQDPAALAASITESLKTPVDRELLMRRARDFSVSTIADKYLDYFGLHKES
jgi:hypothetical protein